MADEPGLAFPPEEESQPVLDEGVELPTFEIPNEISGEEVLYVEEQPESPPHPKKRLHIGAAYYPEQWQPGAWAEDMRLMKEAGLSVVRMAEFAWSSLETAPGEFRFEWLDQAILKLAELGIATVLGTPTAAPPAWLCQQSPDLMAVEENGRRVQFGNRAHYCVNSPEMHAATTRIVEAMAEHFGGNPYVIGWQIDNEFSRVCHCPRCEALFRAFLQERYQTLDELNSRWTTAYWSQTYSDWDQIPLPIGNHNPGLMLEFKRFITASYRKFQKLQIDLLRPKLNPEVWITHNYMGWFDGLDHYEMAADLDMASWDWYIGTGHNDYLKTNAVHDLTRGFKRKSFWVMETQPGAVNWSRVNNQLNKGEARSMAWQAIARGGEGLLYWQWRSALNGQEQLHGSLVDQSGQPRLFYAEINRIASEFERVSDLILGSEYKARAAILNDYESRWSIQWQPHHADFDYVAYFNSFYKHFAALNTPVDVISADTPLDNYRLVIAPATIIMDEKRVNNLKAFVQHGGYLVLTARTAMKDRFNSLLPSRQPGLLTELAGVEVLEYFSLDEDVPVKGNWFFGHSRQWAELLAITDSNVTVPAARYGASNGWLDDQPAITVHGYRSGLVYYVGTNLDEATQTEFMSRVLRTANVHPVLETPLGVQASRRTREDGKEIIFLINHTRQRQSVDLPRPYTENLKGLTLEGKIEMAPYGVAILTPIQS